MSSVYGGLPAIRQVLTINSVVRQSFSVSAYDDALVCKASHAMQGLLWLVVCGVRCKWRHLECSSVLFSYYGGAVANSL